MAKNKKVKSGGFESHKFMLIFGIVFAIFGLVLTYSTFAAPKNKAGSGTVTVSAGTVLHGGTASVAVSPAGENNHVFVQCYSPDINGKYVYAAYFSAKSSPVTVGPLKSTLWPNSDADCTADLGYFTRDGFGRWVSFAKTSFEVKAN